MKTIDGPETITNMQMKIIDGGTKIIDEGMKTTGEGMKIIAEGMKTIVEGLMIITKGALDEVAGGRRVRLPIGEGLHLAAVIDTLAPCKEMRNITIGIGEVDTVQTSDTVATIDDVNVIHFKIACS